MRLSGFQGDRSTITAELGSRLRTKVSGMGQVSKVICTGTTSATKATESDRLLALSRAKAACDRIRSMYPNASYTTKAWPASGVGARHRSVFVEILGSKD